MDNLPPNSPKTKRGANGKFLPKPLLFHLRHPNSKKNQSKFWQILSTKKSFGKTSSALFRHLPEYLEGRTPKKNVLSIFKKNFTPAKSRKQETFFFVVAEALRGGGGTIRAYDLVSSHHARGACALVRLLFEKGSSKVYDYSTTIKRRESGVLLWCAHQESNLDLRLRRPTSYPLNHERFSFPISILIDFSLDGKPQNSYIIAAPIAQLVRAGAS